MVIAFFAPRTALGQDPCNSARFNDFYDNGCHQTPGGAGAPASGALNAGGNNAYCPTCDSADGMPRWWVDEPYINLHVVDEPLSYTTSSGQRMTFRFTYKQRFAWPGLDQISTLVLLSMAGAPRLWYDQYATAMRGVQNSMVTGGQYWVTNGAWSHNWMQNIVFWDATTEWPHGGYPFLNQYEALVCSGDGSVSYFTWNTTSNQTLNVSTQLNNPISQAQLVPMNLGNFSYYISPSNALPQPDSNGIYWGTNCGFKMVYPDGSQDLYTLRASAAAYTFGPPTSQNTSDALLTQRIDPQGRVTKLGYRCVTNWNNDGTFFRLCYVQDPDGRTNTFVYANSTVSPWLLQEIDDPFGRKATFAYTNNTLLQRITDAANNTNSFSYPSSPDASGWLQSLTTPYGTTSFIFAQAMDPNAPTNYEERATYVFEPGVAHQLFAYIHNTSGETEANNTSPTVPGIVFDDGTTGGTEEALYHRNSFHWDRVQTANLSTNASNCLFHGSLSMAMEMLSSNDLNKATMSHWLLGADNISLTETLSSTRAPSPDAGGQIEGEWSWWGYGNSTNAYTQTTSQVAAVAKLLPDGTSQYETYQYYPSGLVSSTQQTFTGQGGAIGVLTNWYNYASNNIDLCSVSNSIGQFTGMGYANHEVTSITNALYQVTTLAYDSTTRNLTGVTNSSGQTISFSYYGTNTASNNAAFLNTITVQPEGLNTTISNYTSALPNVVQLSGTGLATLLVTNTWDNLNRLTGTIFPDGTTTSNVYANLDLVAQTDRLGHTTRFRYDTLDHLAYVTNALTNVTTLDWCYCGSLTEIIDPLGKPTTLSYDNQERLTNVLFADGSSFTNQYDLLGRLTNRIDGAGNSVKYAYNNQGLVTAISNAYGQMLGVGYDAVNRPVTITNADGVMLTRTYDLLNRVTTNAWSDGTTEFFQYSSNGLIAYTNQDGYSTHFGRDGSGRLIAVTNQLQETNQFSYNALDHVVSLTDARGNNTSWAYNEYGWLTNKSALGTRVITNGYDADGHLTTRWMPATGNTTYKRDALGNLTNIIYFQRTNTYSYDAVCRLTNMLDSFGTNLFTTSFTWTPSGQLASETSPWTSDTLSFLYSQGHRTNLNLTQPTSSWNQGYTYDAAWRLQSLVSPTGQFAYGYSSANPASALFRNLSLPNAASITNYYDSMARLDYTALLNYWGHPLDGYGYLNDSWGLRTNITRQLGLTTNIVSVGYDGIGELASWTGKESSGANRLNEQLGYGFDPAGNLQFRTNGSLIQTFTANSLNQISNVTRTGSFTVTGATPAPAASVTVNGVGAQTYGDFTFAATGNTLANGNNTFTIIAQNAYGSKATNILTVNLATPVNLQYDANGNLTNDGTRWLFYDGENQLTNVSVANAWQVAFFYDGLNRRRIERDYTWTNSAWVLTNEVRFFYDGMQVVQERDTNNNPVVTYTRALDLSMSLSGVGGIGGMLARTDANGSAYYHADGNGNITALMDGNENIVARYEYDGFGRLLGQWGTLGPINKMGYSSMPRLGPTGLIGYALRDYDPILMRFTGPDPIQEVGGINLYRFVGNNPIGNVDPYGLQDEIDPKTGVPTGAYNGGPDDGFWFFFVPDLPVVGKALGWAKGLPGGAFDAAGDVLGNALEKLGIKEAKPPVKCTPTAATGGGQQIFRVVNDAELNGIQQSGNFEFPSWGSTPTGQPGKFFWSSQNEAAQFQQMWYQGGESSHIVTTTIRPDVNPMLFPHGDGIGTSMFVNLPDLTAPIKVLPKP